MKKTLSMHIGVLGVLSALLLSACSPASPTVPESSAPGANLELVTPGVLTAVTADNLRPSSFVENGKASGFAIDLMDHIGSKLGLPVEYKVMPVDTALTSLAGGQFDTAAMGLVASPERAKSMDFSAPWLFGYNGLISSKKSPFQSLEEMSGKTLGLAKGSDSVRFITQTYPEVKYREYGDVPSMAAAVMAGQVDATLLGTNGISPVLKQYPDLTVTQKIDLPYPNAFPVGKGKTALKDAISEQVNAMMDDGTFVTLFKKWNPGTPFPPKLLEEYPSLKQQNTDN